MTSKRLVENKKRGTALRLGKFTFLLGIMMMLSAGVFAQTSPDTVNGDPDAPFDGGISLLVAAGVAYGAKQWHSHRKEANTEDTNKQ